MRGDLVSRPIGDVLKEAKALFEGGVKELLVISQDTSAYGVDVKYRTGFWDGKPVKTRMLELVQTLGEMARAHDAWVRLHYVTLIPVWTTSFHSWPRDWCCRIWMCLSSTVTPMCSNA